MTPAQQDHYERCIAAGTSPRLAEMFALGAPPMSNTDREFLEGRGGCYDQFRGQRQVGDYYARVARAAGVDVTGRVYLSGLAAFPGDPRAWVSGRGDAARVCEERGWSCDGAVRVKGDPRQDVWQKYEVAADLVEERAEALLESGAAGDGEEAAHLARQQLSPQGGTP